MIKITNFNGSLDTNPYKFQHYDINKFSLFVNGKRVPNEDLYLDMDHENTSVMVYRTLFEGSGIHHSNSGLQITHVMTSMATSCYSFISRLTGAPRRGYVTPREWQYQDRSENYKLLPEAIACLLYLEYDNSVFVDFSRNVTNDF